MEKLEHSDHRRPGRSRYRSIAGALAAAVLLWLATAGTAAAASAGSSSGALRAVSTAYETQSYVLTYRAWNGQSRESVLLLPADYSPTSTGELPCILLTHPRGGDPYATASIWGDLPTGLNFAVLCAGSAGRRDPVDSWAYSGQLQDLMSLPDLVTASLPWVRLDPDRLYVAGVSMGGTEALGLLAMYPDRLAAAASFDGVADLAAYYYRVPLSRRVAYQARLRREVGGSPRQAPFRYAVRSPLTFARTLATDGVPISVWWSRDDKSVPRQAQAQSGRLCRAVRRIAPTAPLSEHVTPYAHGYVLESDPLRLLRFLRPGNAWRVRGTAPPARWTYASWLPDVSVWGYRFTTTGDLHSLWRVTVSRHKIQMTAPAPVTVALPYAVTGRPASVVLNGQAAKVWPNQGVLTIQFPEGTSTALIDR